MSDQTITSLIEKLEGAEVGSRELDERLWESIHKMPVAYPFDEDQPCIPYGDSAMWVELPRYTTSLDAALALAERMLTMGAWDVGYTYNSDRPHYARLVIVRDDEGQPEIYGRAATPALALCAAILRAQSEARATGEDSPANEGEGR